MTPLSMLGSGAFMILCGAAATWGVAVMKRRGSWRGAFRDFTPTAMQLRLHALARYALVIGGCALAVVGLYRLMIAN